MTTDVCSIYILPYGWLWNIVESDNIKGFKDLCIAGFLLELSTSCLKETIILHISKIFLNYALEKLKLHNSKIIHTDVTIICERPKIDPYRNKIRNNLSKLININKSNISIKATTTEGLGYLGREEGIMVKCLTTILKEY